MLQRLVSEIQHNYWIFYKLLDIVCIDLRDITFGQLKSTFDQYLHNKSYIYSHIKKNWLQFFQTKSKHIQGSTQSWRALYSFDYHAPGQDWSWLHKMYKHMQIEQVLHSQTTCNQFRFHIQIVLISASLNVHIVLHENSRALQFLQFLMKFKLDLELPFTNGKIGHYICKCTQVLLGVSK